jgi:hypothetical protein
MFRITQNLFVAGPLVGTLMRQVLPGRKTPQRLDAELRTVSA